MPKSSNSIAFASTTNALFVGNANMLPSINANFCFEGVTAHLASPLYISPSLMFTIKGTLSAFSWHDLYALATLILIHKSCISLPGYFRHLGSLPPKIRPLQPFSYPSHRTLLIASHIPFSPLARRLRTCMVDGSSDVSNNIGLVVASFPDIVDLNAIADDWYGNL